MSKDLLDKLKGKAEKSENPFFNKPRFYRILRKNKGICKKTGGCHTYDNSEWGLDLQTNCVEFYCGQCKKKFRTVPMRDLPEEWKEYIYEALRGVTR